MNHHKLFRKILPLLLIMLAAPTTTFAIETSRFSSVPVKNDIVLGPTKVEVSVEPGDKIVKYVNVLNRTGQDALFSVSVEDFTPSGNGVVLNGGTISAKSSLKKYLSVGTQQFLLTHGEQARIPVTIEVPASVRPGGLYAAVLVSGVPKKNATGATRIVTRLGSLFFVRVKGEVKQSGLIRGISYRDDGLEIVFENRGGTYLAPSGTIKLYDNRSQELVRTIDLAPWYVLPDTIRTKTVLIPDLAPGMYLANVIINRGYDDVTDVRNLVFSRDRAFSQIFGLILIGLAVIITLALLWKKIFRR